MEKVRKHRDIKLVTTEMRRCQNQMLILQSRSQKIYWLNLLCAKIMTEFVGLRTKSYSYLIDDGSEDKKVKDTKMSVIKGKLKLKIIKTV